jgi:hypothetical protein
MGVDMILLSYVIFLNIGCGHVNVVSVYLYSYFIGFKDKKQWNFRMQINYMHL